MLSVHVFSWLFVRFEIYRLDFGSISGILCVKFAGLRDWLCPNRGTGFSVERAADGPLDLFRAITSNPTA